MEAVDLQHVPVVDNHCHGILRSQSFDTLLSWRRNFTESADPGMPRDHVASTAFYLRLIRALAGFLDCEPDEETVLAARAEKDTRELVGALLWAANIETLLLDTGYPPPEKVLPGAELARLGDCHAEPMLRLETLMERLIAEHDSLEEAKEALVVALDDVRGQGYAALKSIAAYRTGLNIRGWSREEAEASFDEFKEAVREGSARLNHKPLLDTLLHAALAEAARQEVPVQFHVGYGDTDTDLLLGDPLHLRAVLEKPEYRGMPVVLLHGCYPYTRKGSYLAAVYENVYLDLSYGIPLLGFAEMLSFTREALGVAPISKLLYSSDGIGMPELHWMGATDGRRVLSQALEELVAHGELSISEAEAAGEEVLHSNAIRLYRLSSG
ncbi:MAG TPA: amidohydrolase family protein [Rubrobacteraceae bacterium]|nr:amidohydrolase family protein [Rubrobacteraceae bacterium]